MPRVGKNFSSITLLVSNHFFPKMIHSILFLRFLYFNCLVLSSPKIPQHSLTWVLDSVDLVLVKIPEYERGFVVVESLEMPEKKQHGFLLKI